MSWIPKIGAEFADYRLDALLGHGGMSIVYRAEHIRLGRKVALKLLSPQLSEDENFRERFTRESRLAASLDHPNIIPIYEANEAAGVFFIAMRYVEGADLRTLLRRASPLDSDRTISIISQTANALAVAHDRGLVHRDVKPANILIDPGAGTNGSDHVYLSDFGVAKQIAAPGFTKTGVFVGTADYASPEQIEGKTLDGRADVYALGCIVYECLTGSSAYDKDSEVALMYAHLLEPPPSVTAKRPDLPVEIDRVIGRAMAKAAEERYQTAKELATELRSILAAAPTTPGVAGRGNGAPETVLAGASAPAEEGPTAPAPPPRREDPVTPAGVAPADAPMTPDRGRRPSLLDLALVAALMVVGAVLAVVLLSGGDGGGEATPAAEEPSGAAQPAPGGEPAEAGTGPESLIEVLVPTGIANACAPSPTPREAALETHSCTAAEGAPVSHPNEFELSFFPDAGALEQAFTAEKEGVDPVNCTSTRGERVWIHPTTGERGGRRLCYVDDPGSFVIVWTHEKLGSPDHVDMLGIAREPGRSPTSFRTWWNAVNDFVGKCRPQVSEEVCFETIERLAG